jgi:toxin ParE1/3/4
MRVVLSTQAKSGLRDIAAFIGRDNKARARTFARELRDKALELGAMPRAFPIAPRFEDDRVVVIHIPHGARDYEALLPTATGG